MPICDGCFNEIVAKPGGLCPWCKQCRTPSSPLWPEWTCLRCGSTHAPNVLYCDCGHFADPDETYHV